MKRSLVHLTLNVGFVKSIGTDFWVRPSIKSKWPGFAERITRHKLIINKRSFGGYDPVSTISVIKHDYGDHITEDEMEGTCSTYIWRTRNGYKTFENL